MAEYGFDKLCHKVFSARDNGVDFLSRGTGVKCGRCGHELVAYYCESRLYMVQCRHCAIKSLVMAKDRKEAAEKICGCAVDVVKIPSTEGVHRASDGDFIIRGVAGEFYPCKPDIFERTYETAACHNRFARMVTDNPEDNVQTCYNLYYIKDQEVYVRGYGDNPECPDVSLFKFVRDLIGRFIHDETPPSSDEDLSFMLSEWLMFGVDDMEGVLALLYNSAWAMAELRHMLGMYEKIGVHPMELADRNRFVDEWIRGNGMTFKQVADLISLYKGGGIPLAPMNVGDKVWRICWDKVAKEWVVDDTPTFVSEVGTRVFFVSYTNFDPEDLEEPIPFDEIGNTCFLSREEAVAAAAVKAPSEQESEVEEDEKK